ncbi:MULTISPECIES: DUF3575 domain-containing protein [unclassified Lentimicrobium]|uniref:DUF3575 domain-containing protein n=1 Tax=unclassified Lentimicrobium TaxID=2677434 RepID=UPI0015556D7F|nr:MULTISPECIES: DUF3575 domain-containing protein [unclassified Lentimicrobium]NPD45663.1 DUF3575 domain-containing protein [Lentimicrobium sp. S6]NPD86875.1 DUF3575 domain-containing protein [Lentimicrobium sp. L6]
MKKISLLLLVLLLVNLSYGQATSDSSTYKQKKNTIRLNLTPLIINTNNLTLGYERLITPNQSMSVNLGLLLFPQFLSDKSNDVITTGKGNRLGFTTSLDYRFYLSKRNARQAPDGVYIGPYMTYYRYAFGNNVHFGNSDVIKNDFDIDAAFSMTSLGFELGYQFVFWERLTLDMILIGPSFTYYYGMVKVSGEIEIDEESEAYDYIKERIKEKYPWMKTFVDIDAINKGGRFDAPGVGFRYVIMVGFHF